MQLFVFVLGSGLSWLLEDYETKLGFGQSGAEMEKD